MNNNKKILILEQLKLISSLIESVEKKVISQREIEEKLVDASSNKDTAEYLESLQDGGMDDIIKIVLMEEILSGNMAEA
tara:strand:+ start:332 stop:568 length:237 start_codon:yes stop_codon:yes gene_type:complete